MKTKVIGINRLTKKLKRIPLDLRQDLSIVLEDIGREAADDMRSAAPVSSFPDTRDVGHMRDAIDYRMANKGTRVRVGLMGAAANLFFYARFLEYGTRKMVRRSFIRPTFVANGAEYIRRLTERTQKVLERVSAWRPSDA